MADGNTILPMNTFVADGEFENWDVLQKFLPDG
jgi:hypothetical protein